VRRRTTPDRTAGYPEDSPPAPASPENGRPSWRSDGNGPAPTTSGSWADLKTGLSPAHGYRASDLRNIPQWYQIRRKPRRERNEASRYGPVSGSPPGRHPA